MQTQNASHREHQDVFEERNHALFTENVDTFIWLCEVSPVQCEYRISHQSPIMTKDIFKDMYNIMFTALIQQFHIKILSLYKLFRPGI